MSELHSTDLLLRDLLDKPLSEIVEEIANKVLARLPPPTFGPADLYGPVRIGGPCRLCGRSPHSPLSCEEAARKSLEAVSKLVESMNLPKIRSESDG